MVAVAGLSAGLRQREQECMSDLGRRRWIGRLVLEVRRADAEEAAVTKWWLAREALERDAAERVDVARRRRLAATDELGRHVVESSEHLPRAGQHV